MVVLTSICKRMDMDAWTYGIGIAFHDLIQSLFGALSRPHEVTKVFGVLISLSGVYCRPDICCWFFEWYSMSILLG